MGPERPVKQALGPLVRRSVVSQSGVNLLGRRNEIRPTRTNSPTNSAEDPKLEPLVEVLEGKRFVHGHSYRADEILMLLRVDEFGFKIRTLQHVLEGYKVAKEIAAHGAGASTFSDWWSYKVEAFDAIPFNAAIMARKGVLASLNSDSAELIRRLNTEAAKAIKYGGLTETEALSLVTINPAKQLAIDSRVGSIEVGKDADLTIY
jgi:imidazolonepropionase-like amidohydrolase